MLGREGPPKVFGTSLLGVNLLGVEAGPLLGEARRAQSLAGGQCGLWAESVRFLAERIERWLGWDARPMSPVLSVRVVPVGPLSSGGSQRSDLHVWRFKLDGRRGQWPMTRVSRFVLPTGINIFSFHGAVPVF